MNLTDQQVNHILMCVRYCQTFVASEVLASDVHLTRQSYGHPSVPLEDAEIDELCEAINVNTTIGEVPEADIRQAAVVETARRLARVLDGWNRSKGLPDWIGEPLLDLEAALRDLESCESDPLGEFTDAASVQRRAELAERLERVKLKAETTTACEELCPRCFALNKEKNLLIPEEGCTRCKTCGYTDCESPEDGP